MGRERGFFLCGCASFFLSRVIVCRKGGVVGLIGFVFGQMDTKKVKNESWWGGGFEKFIVYLHCKIAVAVKTVLRFASIVLIYNAIKVGLLIFACA